MPTVKELEAFLFSAAPKDLAMHWDNVGLLVGQPEQACSGCAGYYRRGGAGSGCRGNGADRGAPPGNELQVASGADGAYGYAAGTYFNGVDPQWYLCHLHAYQS